MKWLPVAAGATICLSLIWLGLRLKLARINRDNERRRIKALLHNSEYQDKDVTY